MCTRLESKRSRVWYPVCMDMHSSLLQRCFEGLLFTTTSVEPCAISSWTSPSPAEHIPTTWPAHYCDKCSGDQVSPQLTYKSARLWNTVIKRRFPPEPHTTAAIVHGLWSSHSVIRYKAIGYLNNSVLRGRPFTSLGGGGDRAVGREALRSLFSKYRRESDCFPYCI